MNCSRIIGQLSNTFFSFFYTHFLRFLTSKLNSKTVPVLPSLDPSLIFPFVLIPFPVYLTGFSFYIFPGYFAIFILSLNINLRFRCQARTFQITQKTSTSISFQIEWNMIVVTVFLKILNQMEFHLVHIFKRNTVIMIIFL